MQVDLKKNIMSKYSDKIIVGGCSFTDKNYPSRAKPKPLNFKMWPEVIGELYDCEVINTAKCGFGNMAIYHETLDAIIKNKDNIKHVYVMWSEWARQDFLLNDYSYHITQADGSRTKITKRFDTMIPRAENDEYIFTAGNALPLDEAIQHATSEMQYWLQDTYGMKEKDANIFL